MLLAPMFLAASGAERFFEDVPLETVAVLIRPRIFNMRPKESGAKHLGVTVFCFFIQDCLWRFTKYTAAIMASLYSRCLCHSWYGFEVIDTKFSGWVNLILALPTTQAGPVTIASSLLRSHWWP